MRLYTRLLILMLLLALAPTLFSMLILRETRNTLTDVTLERLSAIADVQEQRIRETLERYLEYVRLISSRTQLRASLQEYNAGVIEEGERIDRIIFDAMQASDVLESVRVYGIDGSLVATTDDVPSEPKFTSLSDEEMLVETFGDDDDHTHARLTGPLVFEGERIGTLEVVARIDAILDVATDRTGLEETGETLIARSDENGDAIFLTPLRFGEDAALLQHSVSKDHTQVPAILAVAGEERVLVDGYIDYRGEPIFAVTRYIDELDWGIVVKIDQSEALAPVLSISQRLLIGIVAILFVVGLAVLMTAYFVSKPIHSLTLRAKKMAEGNLGEAVSSDLMAHTGEVGLLAHALEDMRAQVYAAHESLGQQVAERTEALDKQVQETLRFKQAVDSSTDGIVMTTPDGNILYVNESWERITGWGSEEALGKDHTIVRSEKTPSALYEALSEALGKQEPFSSNKFINKRKDGSLYNASLTVFPLIEQGETVFWVYLEQDISDQKAIEQAKTDFVSLASHQLRTPLSAMRWYVEMLIEGDAGAINAKQEHYLKEIERGSLRMIDLVNDLLNVSRLELGTIVLDRVNLSFADLIQEVLRDVQERIRERNIHIIVDFPETVPSVMADRKLLRMIVENLATNAIKYTPKGGDVRISLVHLPAGSTVAGYAPVHIDSVGLQVSDTGMGIPQDQQKRVFEKMFRADNVRASDTDGTGLGLYLIKLIVTLMGGTVRFDSEEGNGTNFFVTVPLISPEKSVQVDSESLAQF